MNEQVQWEIKSFKCGYSLQESQYFMGLQWHGIDEISSDRSPL